MCTVEAVLAESRHRGHKSIDGKVSPGGEENGESCASELRPRKCCVRKTKFTSSPSMHKTTSGRESGTALGGNRIPPIKMCRVVSVRENFPSLFFLGRRGRDPAGMPTYITEHTKIQSHSLSFPPPPPPANPFFSFFPLFPGRERERRSIACELPPVVEKDYSILENSFCVPLFFFPLSDWGQEKKD